MVAKNTSDPIVHCSSDDDPLLARDASHSFEGVNWRSKVSSATLWYLKDSYVLLVTVALEVPGTYKGAVDFEGHVTKMALYHGMFTNGLWRPFCRLVHEVLEFLSLAPV